MKNKRVLIGIVVAVLLAGGVLAAVALAQGGATPALAQDAAATPTPALAQDAGATPAPDINAQRHQKLVTAAQELGLDISGMSDDQIKAAINTKQAESQAGGQK